MEISYRIIRSDRRTIALQIKPDGEILVRCPRKLPEREVASFVDSKRSWLEKYLRRQKPVVALSDAQLKELAQRAREDLTARVERLAPLVGVSWGRITIRSQRTRWGSCSGKGNLNFNCLLMLAPEQVRDYVVVHELCHRKEMNHSVRFWAMVEKLQPDYKLSRKWLKDHGDALIARLP